jgi:hypothetical protein
VVGLAVAEKDEDESAVGGLLSPHFGKPERLLVEPDALPQIQDVEIVVRKPEFHLMLLL